MRLACFFESFSAFCEINCTGRQVDRQTDRQTDRHINHERWVPDKGDYLGAEGWVQISGLREMSVCVGVPTKC
jgi:hypothetical protein